MSPEGTSTGCPWPISPLLAQRPSPSLSALTASHPWRAQLPVADCRHSSRLSRFCAPLAASSAGMDRAASRIARCRLAAAAAGMSRAGCRLARCCLAAVAAGMSRAGSRLARCASLCPGRCYLAGGYRRRRCIRRGRMQPARWVAGGCSGGPCVVCGGNSSATGSRRRRGQRPALRCSSSNSSWRGAPGWPRPPGHPQRERGFQQQGGKGHWHGLRHPCCLPLARPEALRRLGLLLLLPLQLHGSNGYGYALAMCAAPGIPPGCHSEAAPARAAAPAEHRDPAGTAAHVALACGSDHSWQERPSHA